MVMAPPSNNSRQNKNTDQNGVQAQAVPPLKVPKVPPAAGSKIRMTIESLFSGNGSASAQQSQRRGTTSAVQAVKPSKSSNNTASTALSAHQKVPQQHQPVIAVADIPAPVQLPPAKKNKWYDFQIYRESFYSSN